MSLTPSNCEVFTPNLSTELASLFRRDIARLIQQLRAFPEDALLWQHAPGITNSAGNLVLHLEGNLRDFIGRQLGGVSYVRQRDLEFSTTGLPASALVARMEQVESLIPQAIAALSDDQLALDYPQPVLGTTISTRQFLVHLSGHFNYHMGQIDYHRRFLTTAGAVNYVAL